MAYTIVAVCVLVLRYENDNVSINSESPTSSQIVRQIFNLNFLQSPNSLSSNISKISVLLFSLFSVIFCQLIKIISENNFIIWSLFAVNSIAMVLCFAVIACQPKLNCVLNFKVPAVPFLPMLSIFMNCYLMVHLSLTTWIRFVVWIIIGYIIYFTYGIRHSVESDREQLIINEHDQNERTFMDSIDDLSRENNDFDNGD